MAFPLNIIIDQYGVIRHIELGASDGDNSRLMNRIKMKIEALKADGKKPLL